jgi:NTP pyrophosphatase (non-canonical NTP hydrolase)
MDETEYKTPFGKYFKILHELDSDKDTKQYGSFLILNLVEEVGEMARTYLAKQGLKPTNEAAQNDETYAEELGDILVSILNFAEVKGINLDERIMYSLDKIRKRKTEHKV